MDTITSLQNDKVKLAKGLQSRARTRRKERKIVLEGNRLIADALASNQKPYYILYEPQNTDYTLFSQLQEQNTTLIPVSGEVMAHISDTQAPQGMAAVFPMPTPPLPKQPGRVLVLDRVADPGNMGTLFRTAAAAGVDVVVLSPGCADPYNPKTLRSGMGAHFRIPIAEAEWYQVAQYCEALQVYASSSHAQTPYDQVDWRSGWALIIGSEAHGTGPTAGELATESIYIPMAAQTESLNAATAAAIMLFEAARQARADI